MLLAMGARGEWVGFAQAPTRWPTTAGARGRARVARHPTHRRLTALHPSRFSTISGHFTTERFLGLRTSSPRSSGRSAWRMGLASDESTPAVRSADYTSSPSASDSLTPSPSTSDESEWMHRLKVGSYFLLWYVFNVVYNIANKTVLNAMGGGGGWIMAWLQLVLGLPYIFFIWASGIRKAPVLTVDNVRALMPIAAAHAVGHLCTVLSFGAVAISFTHVVKALEPFINVVGSAVFLKSTFAAPVYASLVPIVAGVIMASLSEVSFNWLGFLTAMGSNFAFTTRNLLSKVSMSQPKGKNMSAMNLYAVLTLMCTVLLFPFALAAEWRVFPTAWRTAAAVLTLPKLMMWVAISGLFFYLYNETAFLALDNVHPVTHAVGNTVKRVVIIVASVIVFKNPIDWRGWLGSAIALGGVLLYSLVKQHFDARAAAQRRLQQQSAGDGKRDA